MKLRESWDQFLIVIALNVDAGMVLLLEQGLQLDEALLHELNIRQSDGHHHQN
jgi:hypothetical protein